MFCNVYQSMVNLKLVELDRIVRAKSRVCRQQWLARSLSLFEGASVYVISSRWYPPPPQRCAVKGKFRRYNFLQ